MNSTLIREIPCPHCGAPVELVTGVGTTYRLFDPGVRLLSPAMQHRAGAHDCSHRLGRGLARLPHWRDAVTR